MFLFSLVTECRKVIIVGDSLIKNMAPIDGVTVQSFPGATIARLSMHFSKGHINLENYDYIIIHVGTNNIGNRDSYENIISDFGNLISTVKKMRLSIRIVISAIIPRPVDHEDTDSMIRSVNHHLRTKMSRDMGFHFICTYKAVSKFGTYRRYLFAKLDKGLHLNTEGSNRLRYFFLRVISTTD